MLKTLKKDLCRKGGWGSWEKLDWKDNDQDWEKVFGNNFKKPKNKQKEERV